jgi:uncharacterized protein (TIGR03067 family)
MQRIILPVIVAVLSLAALPTQDDDVKKELKLFQGKWEATGGQSFDGVVPTDAELQLTTLEVEDDKFTMTTGSLTIKGSIIVDPTKKLKTIDVFLGESKDNVMRGIYVIKGDTRKSCFAKPGKDRPDGFRKEKDFLINEWRSVK